MIHIPAGVLRVLNNAKINWNFLSEGEPGTAGRQLQWPRGKTLGGTSSINGMLYVRGNPADYEKWVAAAGAMTRFCRFSANPEPIAARESRNIAARVAR